MHPMIIAGALLADAPRVAVIVEPLSDEFLLEAHGIGKVPRFHHRPKDVLEAGPRLGEG